MELVLLLVIISCLGIVFYATRSKSTQDKLSEHIKAAEVIIASELKEDAVRLEAVADELKKDVQEVTKEVKAAATEVKEVVEEVKEKIKKVSKPKASKTPKTEPVQKSTVKKTAGKGSTKKTNKS